MRNIATKKKEILYILNVICFHCIVYLIFINKGLEMFLSPSVKVEPPSAKVSFLLKYYFKSTFLKIISILDDSNINNIICFLYED